MRRMGRSALALGSWAVATGALALAFAPADASPAPPRPGPAAAAKRPGRAELLAGFDPARRNLTSLARGPARVEAGLAPKTAGAASEQRFVAPLAQGRRAVLTLDPALEWLT